MKTDRQISDTKLTIVCAVVSAVFVAFSLLMFNLAAK